MFGLESLLMAAMIGSQAFNATSSVLAARNQKKEAQRARDEAAKKVADEERRAMKDAQKATRRTAPPPIAGQQTGVKPADNNDFALGVMALGGY